MKGARIEGEDNLKYEDGWALCPNCGKRLKFLAFFGYKCPNCDKTLLFEFVKETIERQKKHKKD